MITRDIFIYFLVNTVTGNAYYYDIHGNLQNISIPTAAVPVDLKHGPGNWMEIELAFERNMFYMGLNRSYSTQMEFVLSTKKMIEQLTLNGVGTETPLTLAIYKSNTQPQAGEPNFKLLYKAPLDLPEATITVLESLSCNLMEGGVAQLFKNYENTVIEIPCDGSLPEHIKCNYDGYLQEDTFYYQITPVSQNGFLASFIPSVFINNEGDNYGVVRNNPALQEVGDDASMLVDPNYIIYFNQQTTVRVKGSIVVQPGDPVNGNVFRAQYRNQFPASNLDIITQVRIFSVTRFEFDFTVTLAPYEKLYIVFFFFANTGVDIEQIVSGSLTIKFATKPRDSRAWGLTAYDWLRLMIKEICRIASTGPQIFNYELSSDLLQQHLNFFINCGDALRASNDPTYQKYFFIDENNQTQFGPVIKMSLRDAYESLRVYLCAAMGKNPTTAGSAQEVFFEAMEYVFPTAVSYSIGEIAKFKYDLQSKDFRLSDFSIGSEPRTYDQKNGKYEWNTVAKYKGPVKAFQKELRLVSKIRVDVYGIQRLLAAVDTGASTSTTRNDSDNDVFLTIIDRSKWIQDYFRALFISLIPNPDDSDNTNIHFEPLQPFQKYDHTSIDGEYFTTKKDFGIFVFSEVGYAATESTNINIDAIINSVNRPLTAPVDSATIQYWLNGVVIKTYTVPVSGINTPVIINDTFSQSYNFDDCIYITVQTSAYCVMQINTADLTIGSYVSMSGVNQPVLSGISQTLINFPTVVPNNNPYVIGTSVVQSGFQYFQYNSLAYANNFDTQLGVLGYTEGQAANFVLIIWVNGVQTGFITIPGSVSRAQFDVASTAFNRNYQLNDIVFVTASPTGSALQAQLVTSTLSMTNTTVRAYSLYRIQYDNLSGIPNLAMDGTGAFRTDIAGAPYNIEFVSPARCFDTWQKFINSHFLNQVTGPMVNQGLSKNPYLSTSVGALTITERADRMLLIGGRYFYPIPVEMEFECPLNFADIQSQLANGHIHFTYYGHDYYMHVLRISQKPALNATTKATGLLSPLVDLSIFANITAFKLPDMVPNSLFYEFMNPIQTVPINQVQPGRYKTFNRNNFLFKQQLNNWLAKDGYCQPVQLRGDQLLPDPDRLTMQLISRDLDPISYTVYKCSDNSIYRGPEELDTIPTPSLASVLYTFILWQKYIDTSDWDEGEYYIIYSSPAGNERISECLDCKFNQPRTVLIEFTSTQNVGQMVFVSDSPFVGAMRVRAFYDNMFREDPTGKFFVDQPGDITTLNGIVTQHTDLYVELCPDYVIHKIVRMLQLDGCKLDGEGYTLNGETEIETIFFEGAPKKFHRIPVRPTVNLMGNSGDNGVVDTDSSIITTINLQSVDPNADNESGTTDVDLLDILVNP